MKLRLKIDLQDGTGPRVLNTNLFVIAEWERLENRRVSDGRGIGASDMACWAYIMLGIKGETLPATWREWLKANPDVEIGVEDATDVNPTDAATGDNSPNL